MGFIQGQLVEAQGCGLVSARFPVTLLVWMVIGVVRGAAGQMPGGTRESKQLSSKSPLHIWKTLEQVLRATSEEHVE